MNAVHGGTGLARPFGNVGPTGTIGHDGIHVVAPAGSRVTTLAPLTGTVIGIHNADEGKTHIVDVLLDKGGFVALYKDLVTVSVRPGQHLGVGSTIGTVGAYEGGGLHFALLNGGRAADKYYRSLTRGGTLERENIYRGGQLLVTYEAGASALKYALTDIQGSTRAIMNNGGASSVIIARHDYLPFGEEVASGIGLRTSGQGYGATDTNRQKFGLTERDDTTGLDHTWWRKYDSVAGRWTTPDPNNDRSVGDPPSFNRYAYVSNDPVNFVDPNGLEKCQLDTGEWVDCGDFNSDNTLSTSTWSWNDLPSDRRRTIFFPLVSPKTRNPSRPQPSQQDSFDDCAKHVWRQFRLGYLGDSGEAVAGGAVAAGGLYVMFGGIPGAGVTGGIGMKAAIALGMSEGGFEGPIHVAQAGVLAGAPLAMLGSMMIVHSIKRSEAHHSALEAGLQDCKGRFPNADHSMSFLNF